MRPRTSKAVLFDGGNILVAVNLALALARHGPSTDGHTARKVAAIGEWAIHDACEDGKLTKAELFAALRIVYTPREITGSNVLQCLNAAPLR